MLYLKNHLKFSRSIKFVFLLSLSMILYSCHGQVNPEPTKKKGNQISEIPFFKAKIDTNDLDPYFTENNFLHTKHGPNSITRNILQDKTGKYWFATWNGVMSYDGKEFTNHTNLSGLRRHRVFSLLENGDEIWFGTIGAGLYIYNGSTFTNITSEDGLDSDEIECMFKDQEGRIWLGTGSGVSVYDGKEFHNYAMEDGLADSDVHSIAEDREGKIWIGSANGISIYDDEKQGKGQKAFTRLTTSLGRSFYNVRTIISDREGAIWFGGNDGLMYYNNGTFTTLTKNFVGHIYEDEEGDILFNKPSANDEGGIGIYRYKKGQLPHYISAENIEKIKQESEMVFGIIEDSDGNIWYGRVGGVTKFDGVKFEYFK